MMNNITYIKYAYSAFRKSSILQYIVSIAISTSLSTIIIYFILVRYADFNTMDHVKHSAKVATTRLWLEKVVDRICEQQIECTTLGRSFAYHINKHSGTWCMGHRNMFLDKDYLGRKEIYIDYVCKQFLENNSYASFSYEVMLDKCHDLTIKCLFEDAKFKHNTRAYILCKRDYKIHNAVSCVSLVSGNDLDKYLSMMEEFKLNNNLSFFGD